MLLLLMIRNLLHDLGELMQDTAFHSVLFGLAVLLVTGTVFYSWTEGWSLLDALYFCVVSLATVGYGDLTPRTAVGKVFTMVYLFVGIGTFVLFAARVAEARMQRRLRRHVARRYQRRAARASQERAAPPRSADESSKGEA